MSVCVDQTTIGDQKLTQGIAGLHFSNRINKYLRNYPTIDKTTHHLDKHREQVNYLKIGAISLRENEKRLTESDRFAKVKTTRVEMTIFVAEDAAKIFLLSRFRTEKRYCWERYRSLRSESVWDVIMANRARLVTSSRVTVGATSLINL